MIFLKKNKKNNIMRRFFDRIKHCNSYFLWKVYDSKNELLFKYITNDTSVNSMYNIFLFELDDNEQLYNSGIDIILNLKSGHHYYEVYETSEYSLDEEHIIQLIERDILMVELIREVNSNITNDIYY